MKTYPLTPSQFNALRLKMLQAGVPIPNDTQGAFTFKTPLGAVEAKYHFDGAKLTLSILKKPVFLSAGMIWEHVDQWVAGV